MSKKEVKQKFLDKLEFYYRNFGNEWTLDDFVTNPNQKEYLFDFLLFLESKGIVKLNTNGLGFTILDLPSNHSDLNIN